MNDDPAFLSRWSRRKQQAREEVEETPPAESAAEAPPEPEKPEAEILAELGLKDPDEMAEGDDFSAFMSAAVPQALRNRALKKLWLTNPAFADLDGLLDYGEDFTGNGGIVGKMATAYRVGKGYAGKLAEKTAEDDPELVSESPDGDDGKTAELLPLELSAATVAEKKSEEVESAVPENAGEIATQSTGERRQVVRKRMKFRF